jgi:vancomycin permeability regulator SanA
VLGASVKTATEPSDTLLDRLKTTIELYQSGQVRQILLTGDGGAFRSNEIKVMKQALLAAGVPDWVISTDEEGFRTYESCKRAHEVFGITKAIVITQRFHLARSLFLCHSFGIDAIGIIADKQTYRRRGLFALRELGASVKAAIDVFLFSPEPPVEVD